MNILISINFHSKDKKNVLKNFIKYGFDAKKIAVSDFKYFRNIKRTS